MARNAEQIAADEELVAAIEKVMRANSLLGEGFLLEDCLVLVSSHGFSDETFGRTEYVHIMPGENGISWHRAIGLMEVCGILMRQEITTED